MFNFNAKVLRDIFKTKIECQLTYKLYSKCHLNFGLHNILEKLIFWFIKTQSWFLTKKNKIKKKKNHQSSVSILQSCMFPQMFKMVALSKYPLQVPKERPV